MIDKCYISGFISNSGLDKKIATVATKGELKAEEGNLTKLQALISNYFYVKSNFKVNETQKNLVFQIIYRYFKRLVILSLFQHGNLNEFLMNASSLLNLVIILFHG